MLMRVTAYKETQDRARERTSLRILHRRNLAKYSEVQHDVRIRAYLLKPETWRWVEADSWDETKGNKFDWILAEVERVRALHKQPDEAPKSTWKKVR